MQYPTTLVALCGLSLVACVGTADGLDAADLVAESSAIVGGEVDQDHSYVVSLGNVAGAWCTGTVISARTVITAAHCVDPAITYGEQVSRVFFGGNAFAPELSVGVEQVVVHPDWNATQMRGDVALIELSEPAPVQAAPLLREEMDNSDAFVGPQLTFVGFGVDDGVAQTGFGTRRVVRFPISSVGETTTPDGWSTHNHEFFYQLEGMNTCVGDSGGPAFLTRDGVERHAGVTSWGDWDCTGYGVDHRTDLPVIDSFLQQQIDAFEPDNACRNDGSCADGCVVDGEVLDPDCAADHCEADGVCSAACASPADPDCAEATPPELEQGKQLHRSAADLELPSADDELHPEAAEAGGCSFVGAANGGASGGWALLLVALVGASSRRLRKRPVRRRAVAARYLARADSQALRELWTTTSDG